MKREPDPRTLGTRIHVPVRIADVGGWTDTWFAEHGVVCNLAVGPGVNVTVTATDTAFSTLELPNLHATYVLDSVGTGLLKRTHPMLAECWARHGIGIGSGRSVRLSIDSAVPPGSSLGTSAAVGVAVIAGLRAVSNPPISDCFDADELATLAHRAETRSGLESGVQDHVAAAHGGINLIGITYPGFTATPLNVTNETRAELDRRLITLYFGRPHESSVLHEMVIARLEATGSGATELEYLRSLAVAAADALVAGDLGAYGDALMGTVEGQRALHPGLISAEAQQALLLTERFGGSLKVNGAGGPGGSVTILGPEDPNDLSGLRRSLAEQSSWKILDLRLWSSGVTIN